MDDSGQLVFHEGALVRAVRHGHWVILDELNLAPTDVLEALNRLLDDNRELFVPELQETIQPHPHFMLFGTQNPAGAYAGKNLLLPARLCVLLYSWYSAKPKRISCWLFPFYILHGGHADECLEQV